MGTAACRLVIPPFEILRQENLKLEMSLDNIRLCLSQTNKQKVTGRKWKEESRDQKEGYMIRCLTTEVSLKQNFKIYFPAGVHPSIPNELHLLCTRNDSRCESTKANI